MNGEDRNRAAADRRPASLYQLVRDLRRGGGVDGRTVSHLVLGDGLFREKFRRALAAAVTRAGHRRDEIGQAALIGIDRYFVKYGLSGYTDGGEREFGGWLYALCRRHVGWAARRD